ncbi:MAG: hypothetical protein IPL88_00190 [Rhizobiales bacterium]|nr:hypothetical protein [Hyphomicrobiales bacterium]
MSALLRELVPPLAALIVVFAASLAYVAAVSARRDALAVLITLLFLLFGSIVYDAFDSVADETHDALARATAVSADLLIVSMCGKMLAVLAFHRAGAATAALIALAAFLASFGLHYLDDIEPQLYVGLSPAAKAAASGVLAYLSLVAHALVVTGVLIFVERKRGLAPAH